MAQIDTMIADMPALKKSLDDKVSIKDDVEKIQTEIVRLSKATWDADYKAKLTKLLESVDDNFSEEDIKTNFGDDIWNMMPESKEVQAKTMLEKIDKDRN